VVAEALAGGRETLGVIADECRHGHSRMACPVRGGELGERLWADVDGHVLHFEQRAGLGAVSGPEVHEHERVPTRGGDHRGVLGEDLRFGTREVVFRNRHDPLE
jgi:hypothetical protein